MGRVCTLVAAHRVVTAFRRRHRRFRKFFRAVRYLGQKRYFGRIAGGKLTQSIQMNAPHNE